MRCRSLLYLNMVRTLFMPPCYGRNHGTYYSQPRHFSRRNCRSIKR